jgi:hypothetical protein
MINNQKNKFLKATIFIIFIILIGVAIFYKKPIIKKFFNEDKKLNTSLPYARAMLSRVYGTNKPFSGRSPEEIAKFLNHLVFSYCRNEAPRTGVNNINELFNNCNTECGGYSYVLRGLLNVYGIKTRYSNFYNLPQQGNHTAVEVEIEKGRWSLFDPTFGVFFTLDGNPESQPLSTEEVRFLLDEVSIFKSVNSVSTKRIVAENHKLINLYNNKFSADYMKLENYLLAEQAVSGGANAVVPLILPVDLKNGYVMFGSKTFLDLNTADLNFLNDTNNILNNESLEDDVSFLFRIIGKNDEDFRTINILRFNNLIPGIKYDLEIYGYAPNYSKIQIVPIGRSAKINKIEPNFLEMGKFTILYQLKPEASSSDFVITGTPNFFIFGLEGKIAK